MSFRHVQQDHESGCFVACVAMILKVPYWQAVRIIHPHINVNSCAYSLHNLCLPLEESIKRLTRLGVRLKPARTRKLGSLSRDALLIIRWAMEPSRMHAVIYDHNKNRILDPAGRIYPLSEWKGWKIAWVEDQLDAVYYIKD